MTDEEEMAEAMAHAERELHQLAKARARIIARRNWEAFTSALLLLSLHVLALLALGWGWYRIWHL